MPRKKSTDTPEVKALRKLLLSLGLSATTASQLIAQMGGRMADLSAKACEIEMYIAAHPEVKRPAAYAARTLKNFADEQEAVRNAMPVAVASADAPKATGRQTEFGNQQPSAKVPQAPVKMELWGDDEQD